MNFIIYSHTDYLDILNIQTDYTKNIKNRNLLINRNNQELDHIYSQYDNIIFYDDSLPYASRLLSLSQIDAKYILLTHDIDIVLHMDIEFIENLKIIIEENEIDRVDLQYYSHSSDDIIDMIDFNLKLIKQNNTQHFIYNVNPSIWKLESLIEVMSNFKHDTYRSIEKIEVQNYCKKFNIYKLFSNNFIELGYFNCIFNYQFLHITHGGRLLPKINNGMNLEYNDKYKYIYNKYLNGSLRPFRENRW